MHLVYSAFRNSDDTRAASARRRGYLAACQKHRDTIASIQQYLPGWMPAFQVDNGQLTAGSKQLAVSS